MTIRFLFCGWDDRYDLPDDSIVYRIHDVASVSLVDRQLVVPDPGGDLAAATHEDQSRVFAHLERGHRVPLTGWVSADEADDVLKSFIGAWARTGSENPWASVWHARVDEQ